MYSGGFHHIQVPGESRWPKLFKPVRARLEILEIDAYKKSIEGEVSQGNFRQAVIRDMTRRRDLNCPPLEDPSLKGGSDRA